MNEDLEKFNENLEKYINTYLRGYQGDAVRNIFDIYNREQYNRFASVVLPTGGGKSFIAMAAMQMINNPEFNPDGYDAANAQNTSSMIYVAPTHEILTQIRRHIVKNILIPNIPDLENKSIDDINTFLRESILDTEFQGITLKDPTKPLSVEEKKSLILNAISDQGYLKDAATKVFPRLKLKCYAGAEGKEDVRNADDTDVLTEDDVKKCSFLVLDEAHKVGAKTYNERIKKIIEVAGSELPEGQTTKILAVSATPERNDKESKEMMGEIASIIYNEPYVKPEIYTAQEIYVIDAMKNGLINSPEVISPDFSFYYTKEYKTILQAWQSETDEKRKAEFEKILDNVEEIMGISSNGFPDRVIPEKTLKEYRIIQTREAIKKELESPNEIGKMTPNDKTLVFIPNKPGDVPREDFISKYKEEIMAYYEGVIDPHTGKQIEITFHELSSSFTNDKNDRELVGFENASEKEPGLHIMLVQAKAKEGLHIEGIKQMIDLRGGETEGSTMQKAGRTTSSLDPDKPLCKHDKTRIIDSKASLFRRAVDGTADKTSLSYDIFRLKEIKEWILANNRFPDINAGADIRTESDKDNVDDIAQARAEAEVRIAAAIKRYQEQYKTYSDPKYNAIGQESLTQEFKELVESMPVINGVSFENVKIPERTKEPSIDELTGSEFLVLTPTQEKLMEEYAKARNLIVQKRDNAKARIEKLTHIISVINEYKPDIQWPNGIMTRENVWDNRIANGNVQGKQIKACITCDVEHIDLKEFLDENFSKTEIEEITDRIRRGNEHVAYRGEEYDLGEELAYFRGKFFTSAQTEDNARNPFDSISPEQLFSLGVVSRNRVSRLVNDVYNMFAIKPENLWDFAGTENETFVKRKDAHVSFVIDKTQYWDTPESKKREPYSYTEFGISDKYTGRSIVTGKEVQTVADIVRAEKEAEAQRKIQEAQEIEKRRLALREKERQQKEEEQKRKDEENRKRRAEEKIKKFKDIRQNPEKYFAKTKSGAYYYKHELFVGPPNHKKILYSKISPVDERGYTVTKDGVYKLHSIVLITRHIMTNMITKGMSMDEACQDFAKRTKIKDPNVAKNKMQEVIGKCMQLYEDVPSILGPQQEDGKKTFEGFDQLLYSGGNFDKKARINEFLDFAGRDTVLSARRSVLEKDKELLNELDKELEIKKMKRPDRPYLNNTQNDAYDEAKARIESYEELDDDIR